ncbi:MULTISPECIES: DUF421 domain-containing protein [unclassified Bacillus (in: firmicutes)]|uniref:DUF421 domain-containing protein n=1 Tax=unclassified Bacillus (in: firmicutes) TaxID=185979 RepID=UPI000BF098AE|nr:MULTISPECIES: DUF421 domain-containing protein [unclassified Bacillus (in: firmicutes)]PEJ51783.1 hypothetical protein CN692_22695 [Bacillus sp. AFS002410]PEK98657.1 hypothetical protein CN601_25075 [Bacillus sp. AFS017336]
MELGSMTIRTILIYLIIAFFFRIMGKREIGELSLLDLVVYILLTEIAAIGIENHNDPIIKVIYPMFLIVAIQIIFSLISLKSVLFRKILDGNPVLIISKGKVLEKEMKKQRYTFDDLLLQLREKDIGDVRDVDYAILEPTGKLSIFKKELNGDGYDSTLTFPLILDGIVQDDNLKLYHKNKLWLLQELKKHGIDDFDQVSYCSLRDDEIFFDKKDG